MEKEATAEELFDRGMRLIEARHDHDALRNLKKSYQMNPDSSRCLSYLGLALAYAEKRYREAEELCQLAIRKEFYHPEYYLNLGRVYLHANHKKRAIWVFRKGLEVDKSDVRLRRALENLGQRAQPVIKFLPRAHIMNRTLGKVRQKVTSAGAVRLRSSGPTEAPRPGRP
jgi:tetratricopeptide (TPR) repeat protein